MDAADYIEQRQQLLYLSSAYSNIAKTLLDTQREPLSCSYPQPPLERMQKFGQNGRMAAQPVPERLDQHPRQHPPRRSRESTKDRR